MSRAIQRSINELKGIKINPVIEKLEDIYDDVMKSPRRIKYWIKSTFTKKTIKIKTLHGGWHDSDNVILHASFQILVDFVEKELANMHDACLNGRTTARTPREKGEAYLLWQDDLSDYDADSKERYAQQKAKDTKILELYRWWVDTRAARVDKWDTDEALKFELYEPFTFEPYEDGSRTSRMVINTEHPLAEDWNNFMEQGRLQEDAWLKEDDNKLHELIEIRHCLWS